MKTLTNRKNKKSSKEIVRSDVNIERWEIFAPSGKTKERTIARTTKTGSQEVNIGFTVRKGKSYTLTTSDGKAYYALLKIWELSGKPNNSKVRFTLSNLCKLLDLTRNTRNYEWLKQRLLNLREVPIRFIECYEVPGGEERVTASFSLLDHVWIFERSQKEGNGLHKYFSHSEFKLNETIAEAIIKGKVKPVRLDVIRTLSRDCAFILYRHLDLMLSERSDYLLNLIEAAKICDLEDDQPLWKVKQTIQEACKILEGKDITTGRIIYCRIERTVDGRKWNLVVHKGKQKDLAIGSNIEYTSNEIDSLKINEFYENLTQEKRLEIDRKAEELTKQNHGISTNLGIQIEKENIVRYEMEKDKSFLEKNNNQSNKLINSNFDKTFVNIEDNSNQEFNVIYIDQKAMDVQICGDWNKWIGEQLNKKGSDLWKYSKPLPPGKYKYKLLVDGRWKTNPNGQLAGDDQNNNLLIVETPINNKVRDN